jgi:hypothetical protein
MLSRDTLYELCCFAATCCAVITFLLAIFALDLTADGMMSKARVSLLVSAGIAFGLTIVLTAIAVQMERNTPAGDRAHQIAEQDEQGVRGQWWR